MSTELEAYLTLDASNWLDALNVVETKTDAFFENIKKSDISPIIEKRISNILEGLEANPSEISVNLYDTTITTSGLARIYKQVKEFLNKPIIVYPETVKYRFSKAIIESTGVKRSSITKIKEKLAQQFMDTPVKIDKIILSPQEVELVKDIKTTTIASSISTENLAVATKNVIPTSQSDIVQFTNPKEFTNDLKEAITTFEQGITRENSNRIAQTDRLIEVMGALKESTMKLVEELKY